MEYRSEVETLKRERQMHVESLRIIERDIALVCSRGVTTKLWTGRKLNQEDFFGGGVNNLCQ